MREKYEGVVDLKNMKQETLGSILDFIYTGFVGVTDDNVCDLLESSDYAQVNGKPLPFFHCDVALQLFHVIET